MNGATPSVNRFPNDIQNQPPWFQGGFCFDFIIPPASVYVECHLQGTAPKPA